MNSIRFAVLGVSAVLAACATSPAANTALSDAHAAVDKLSNEPEASQVAGKPLQTHAISWLKLIMPQLTTNPLKR